MLSRGAVVLAFAAMTALPGTAHPVAVPPPGYLQVVAHPDDDILFMNPDLTESIRDHSEVTSVYLTAGESDVWPAASYAAQRQAGTRAAFARMARVPDLWRAAVLDAGGGRTAEMYTLLARPDVRLIFLNLPDDNSPHATGGKHALTRIRESSGTSVETSRPAGSPLRRTSWYDREAVITTLTGLYARFDPDVVRMHDPAPDLRYQPHWGRHHDHPDHVATAHLAGAALLRHDAGRGSVQGVHYRGYNIADTTLNLSPSVVTEKRETFRRYATHDRMVSLGDPYATWLRGMRYRWERGDDWAATDQRGVLHVVRVVAGRLHLRQEGHRSAALQSIVDSPGAVQRGSPVLVRDRAGALSLVAQLRETRDIIVRRRTPAGDWAPGWVNLGSPGHPAMLTRPGPPAAVATADGRLMVAAKNSRGGVSVRFENSPGLWSREWIDLGGTGVQDGVAAVVDRAGKARVFASSASGLLHWEQSEGRRFVLETLPHHPAGRIVADGDATPYVAFRAAESDRVVVLGDLGGWSVVAEVAVTGHTAPALAIAGDQVPRLAARDGRGDLVLFELPRASPVRRRVVDERVTGQPAFTPDGRSLVAARLGGNTAVHVVAPFPVPWTP